MVVRVQAPASSSVLSTLEKKATKTAAQASAFVNGLKAQFDGRQKDMLTRMEAARTDTINLSWKARTQLVELHKLALQGPPKGDVVTKELLDWNRRFQSLGLEEMNKLDHTIKKHTAIIIQAEESGVPLKHHNPLEILRLKMAAAKAVPHVIGTIREKLENAELEFAQIGEEMDSSSTKLLDRFANDFLLKGKPTPSYAKRIEQCITQLDGIIADLGKLAIKAI